MPLSTLNCGPTFGAYLSSYACVDSASEAEAKLEKKLLASAAPENQDVRVVFQAAPVSPA